MTSQIFANIYLNEFDHFVRHELKPLAYMRYGDDFVMYIKDRKVLMSARLKATDYLQNRLAMQVHLTNNVVVRVSHGLHFLGHIITSDALVIESRTQRKIRKSVDHRTIASYQALALPKDLRRELPWLLDIDT